MRLITIRALLIAGLLSPVIANAVYPEKPVRVLVGFPGGDTTDLVSRVAAPALAELLKQPFIVDNHPGANGILATARAAKAKPDGYTVLFVSSAFTVNPSLYPQRDLNPLRDFAAVSRVAKIHHVLLVQTSARARTLGDFLSSVRANPGKVVFASGGNGSPSHLAAELLKLRAGPLNTLHVPYKGPGAALAELIGGHVDALFVTLPWAFPQVRAGKVRALAVGGLKRSPALPDVPTLDESGVTGFDASAWNAIVAPAGTPYDMIVRLSLATAQAVGTPAVKERLTALGAEPANDTPEQCTEFLRTELAKWAKVVKAAGITAE